MGCWPWLGLSQIVTTPMVLEGSIIHSLVRTIAFRDWKTRIFLSTGLKHCQFASYEPRLGTDESLGKAQINSFVDDAVDLSSVLSHG